MRCLDYADNFISSYNSTGLSITYVAAPVLSSITRIEAGLKISWEKVTGAAKYRVYRKTGTGSWVKISDTASTAYSDKSVVSGTKYTYTVRCLDFSGTTVSSFDSTGLYETFCKDYPSYSVVMPEKADSDARDIVMVISNSGEYNLTIYSQNANLIDSSISDYDRQLRLMNKDFNYVSSITIAAGKAEAFIFRVVGDPTWYDRRTRIVYDIKYDGVKYRAYTSEYYGTSHHEY